MIDAANNNPAPTTLKMKCHQLQANSLVTSRGVEVVHVWNVGQVVAVGVDMMTAVPVKREIVQSTNMAQRPTTTTIRSG